MMLNCLKGRSWYSKGLDVKEKDDCITYNMLFIEQIQN